MIGSPTDRANLRGSEKPFVGLDGFCMLALSFAVAVASGGTTVAIALVEVVRGALGTPAAGCHSACILVLGKRLSANGEATRDYRARLDRAHDVLLRDRRCSLFLVGGRTRAGQPSEAAVGVAYLRAAGVSADRLDCEDRSRHTLENLRHYRTVSPSGAAEATLLITSRYHVARAVLMARGMGLRCTPCAAESSRVAALRRPDRLLLEALFLHWYVVGSCFSRWTGNARMLARIT